MKKLIVSTVVALLLLTVLASSGVAAPAATVQVPFKGFLQAVETYQPNFPTLLVTSNGSGTSTILGQYTVAYQVVVNIPTGSGPASAAFRAANGDSLFAEGFGQGVPTEIPNIHKIVEKYTITGGTGRFAGATGSFTVNRLVNLTTGATSGTFDGNLVMILP